MGKEGTTGSRPTPVWNSNTRRARPHLLLSQEPRVDEESPRTLIPQDLP